MSGPPDDRRCDGEGWKSVGRRQWLAAVLAAVVLVGTVGFVPVGVGAADGPPGTEQRPVADRTAPTSATIGPPDPDPNESVPNDSTRSHPKVADGVFDRAGPAGPNASSATGTPTATATGDGTIPVVVETEPGAAERVARVVEARGRVVVAHGSLVEARLPPWAVRAVANRSDVRFVRRPYRLEAPGDPPESTAEVDGSTAPVTSEGVAAIDADDTHRAGYTGDRATVVIVDGGFDVDDPEIADSIARTKDFTGDGIDVGRTDHGTATAQIVADVAPDARLVLVSVGTYTQMIAAADWIDAETDADVVSMSLGLPGGAPLDGTARIDRTIADSVEDGTTWMVSAGNEGDGGHWNGTWRDGDGDGWLNFTGDDETLAVGAPMSLTVQWPDWPTSEADYDLFLFDGDGDVVASSETVQSGLQPPVERLAVRESGTFYLGIRRVDAAGETEFDLFYSDLTGFGPKPEYWTAARSLVVPATSPNVTAVGAAAVDSLDPEPFTSEGPTIDGRRKPAFVGPDRVTTSVYRSFPGTSAAAPHAAGAAALVASADPTLSPAEVTDRLARTADDLDYEDPPNNRVGSGLLDADEAVRPPDPVSTAILTAPITGDTDDAVRVRVELPAPPETGNIVVRLRDATGRVATGRAPADTEDGTTVVTVDASGLSTGPVTARSKVVDPLDNENPERFTAPSSAVEYGGSAPVVFERTLSRENAAPNATATVITRIRVRESTDRLALIEEFDPDFEAVQVVESRVSGEASVRFSAADEDSITYAVEDLSENDTLVLEYDVRLPDDADVGDRSVISGRVTAGDTDVRLVDEIAVEPGPAAYADDDGVVRDGGLREAIADWAGGDLSDAGLRRVILAWSSGEPVA